jgi:glutamate synthase (NADPH/NADH) small chain
LNRIGFDVTVYDRDRRAGGILRYGIPDFKLEKWVVDRRICLMEAEGVYFEMGVSVGEDISYRYLRSHHDAVCLACGAREPRDLSIPGRGLDGIHFAMDYLAQQNRRNAGESIDSAVEITARNKAVVVLGGGDTGSDCVGNALRQGAASVTQLEILPKPPLKRSESTPWPMWPLILRTTHAHEEGGERRWSVMTKAFLGEKGAVKKLRCVEVTWETPDGGGPAVPVEKPESEFELQADLVLLCLGFSGPEKNRIVDQLGLERDGKGNLRADQNRMTSAEGIFVAGDMAEGQSLVVRAVADGRRAARGIWKYLEGF